MAETGAPGASSLPSDPRGDRAIPGGLGIIELAKRAGHYRWAETAVFETLGAWVATIPEAEVRARLGAQCHKHAWHADLWLGRMPGLRGVDVDLLTVPANDALERFVGALREPDGVDTTIEKLAGMYRVFIPRFVAAYTSHLENTSEAADAPTVRALRHMLQDEIEDWRDGEMLLQSLIGGREHAERASSHQARLEALMVEAGGVAGS